MATDYRDQSIAFAIADRRGGLPIVEGGQLVELRDVRAHLAEMAFQMVFRCAQLHSKFGVVHGNLMRDSFVYLPDNVGTTFLVDKTRFSLPNSRALTVVSFKSSHTLRQTAGTSAPWNIPLVAANPLDAPEMLETGQATVASDMWRLGHIIFEALFPDLRVDETGTRASGAWNAHADKFSWRRKGGYPGLFYRNMLVIQLFGRDSHLQNTQLWLDGQALIPDSSLNAMRNAFRQENIESLLRRLFEPDPAKRLDFTYPGGGYGLVSSLFHPFFAHLEREGLDAQIEAINRLRFGKPGPKTTDPLIAYFKHLMIQRLAHVPLVDWKGREDALIAFFDNGIVQLDNLIKVWGETAFESLFYGIAPAAVLLTDPNLDGVRTELLERVGEFAMDENEAFSADRCVETLMELLNPNTEWRASDVPDIAHCINQTHGALALRWPVDSDRFPWDILVRIGSVNLTGGGEIETWSLAIGDTAGPGQRRLEMQNGVLTQKGTESAAKLLIAPLYFWVIRKNLPKGLTAVDKWKSAFPDLAEAVENPKKLAALAKSLEESTWAQPLQTSNDVQGVLYALVTAIASMNREINDVAGEVQHKKHHFRLGIESFTRRFYWPLVQVATAIANAAILRPNLVIDAIRVVTQKDAALSEQFDGTRLRTVFVFKSKDGRDAFTIPAEAASARRQHEVDKLHTLLTAEEGPSRTPAVLTPQMLHVMFYAAAVGFEIMQSLEPAINSNPEERLEDQLKELYDQLAGGTAEALVLSSEQIYKMTHELEQLGNVKSLW
jgi:hypothetical protein